MSEDAGGRRSRRRCVQNKSVKPSATFYVGYVEDDETPEMIMKKFEEMEKVLSSNKPADVEALAPGAESIQVETTDMNDGNKLSEQDLLEIFKQTSTFNVKTVLTGNEVLFDNDMLDSKDYDSEDGWSEDEFVEDLAHFWSDEDGDFYKDRFRRNRKSKGASRVGTGHLKPRHVTHYNAASQAFIRRKVVVVDVDAVIHVQIPPAPLPLAWARTVVPYIPKHLLGYKTAKPQYLKADQGADVTPVEPVYLEVGDMAETARKNLRKDYLGVLINSDWESGTDGSADGVADKLAELAINKLCPTGFVFIWTEKEHISEVMDIMYKWKYIYVENLNWVYFHANNEIMGLPSPYFGRSHLTLFIFRRDGVGKDIELRHQRKPDVIFDCISKAQGRPYGIPEETYVTIETLLPTAKGRLLELWAPAGVQRDGWTHVVQTHNDT